MTLQTGGNHKGAAEFVILSLFSGGECGEGWELGIRSQDRELFDHKLQIGIILEGFLVVEICQSAMRTGVVVIEYDQNGIALRVAGDWRRGSLSNAPLHFCQSIDHACRCRFALYCLASTARSKRRAATVMAVGLDMSLQSMDGVAATARLLV